MLALGVPGEEAHMRGPAGSSSKPPVLSRKRERGGLSDVRGDGETALRATLQHGLPRSAVSGDSGPEGRVGSLLHLAKSSAVS